MGEFLERPAVRALLAVIAIVVLAGGGYLAWRLGTQAPAAESVAAEAARARGPAAGANPNTAPAAKLLTVFVSGAVAAPGVYQLPRGARVSEAIDAAGGLLPGADMARLPNLAGKLTDGKQVKVPRRGATTAAASRLDINSATVDELLAVPGMDAATAQAIVDQREGYGPFLSLTELHTLLGLDVQVVAALRPFLRVGSP